MIPTAVKQAPKSNVRWLVAACAAALSALRSEPSWTAQYSGGLPWDQTLGAIQDILVGPVAHAVITLTAVVVDPECEFVSEFYQPGRGDFILNPLDARCPRWSPWYELRHESHDADCEALAASLLPDPPDAYHEGGASFFFRQSSRTLLTSIFRIAEPKEAASIPRLLTLPRAELRQALANTPAEALIDAGAHEQGEGIVATPANATNAFRYLPVQASRTWSALEWSAERHGWLFLTSSEESKDAALPPQSVWLDCIIHRLMSGELEPRRREQVWIVADELAVLRRQAKLEDLVVRGRKRGLAVCSAFRPSRSCGAFTARIRPPPWSPRPPPN